MKKLIVLLLAAAMMMSCFTGCSSQEETTAQPETTAAVQTTEEVHTLPVVTVPEVVPEETSEEAETLPEGMMYSYLTGEVVPVEIGTRRPVAFQVDKPLSGKIKLLVIVAGDHINRAVGKRAYVAVASGNIAAMNHHVDRPDLVYDSCDIIVAAV